MSQYLLNHEPTAVRQEMEARNGVTRLDIVILATAIVLLVVVTVFG